MDPVELPSIGKDVTVIQVLDSKGGVSNVHVNMVTGASVPYAGGRGVTLPDQQCEEGTPNIDNVCLCKRGKSSTAFIPHDDGYRSAYMDALFTPTDAPNPLSPGAQALIDRFNQQIRQ